MKPTLLPSVACVIFSILLICAVPGDHSPLHVPAMQNPDTGLHSSWFAGVAQNITAEEYSVEAIDESTYNATNRANKARFEIGAEGFIAKERESSDDWQIHFRISEINSGDLTYDLSRPLVQFNKREIDYAFSGLTIQYINNEDGLRQNFIFGNNPGNSSELKVSMELQTPLAVKMNGGDLCFTKDGITKLCYTDLHVYDAMHNPLPASMQLRGGTLEINADVSHAIFPVTIDPLSTTPDWMAESNQVGAHMGFAVSTAGDVNHDGYADVLVGAIAYDDGETDEGKAYLFLGGPAGLASSPAWTAESNVAGALFGKSVAAAGDVNGDGHDDILIGAGDYSGPEVGEGKVYLFYGTASGATASPVWTFESNQAGAALGYPVEGLGDVNGDGYADVIVGANGYTDGETEEGVAFAFYGSPSGLPATPNWTVESNNETAHMGHAVSSAGDVNGDGYDDAVVGAWNYTGAVNECGKAWVYLGGPSGLSTTAVWSMEGTQEGDNYGFWAHNVGDVNNDGYSDIMVAAKRYDDVYMDEGIAFLFLGSPTGPSTTPAWTMEGGNDECEFGDQFGPAGDVNGDGYDDLVIGAHYYTNTQWKEGAAFLFYGEADGLAATPAWVAYGGVAQANYGWSVDGAGDVNGDGFDDWIVGEFKYKDPETDEGAIFEYNGSGDCTSADMPTVSGSSVACPGEGDVLSVASGSLHGATNWQWYSGSCGGTPAGTGSSITVYPTSSTVYYVRGEGGCAAPGLCGNFSVSIGSSAGNVKKLKVRSFTSCSILYSWKSTPGAVSYEADYKESSDPTWTELGDIGASPNYLLSGLTPLTSYDFRVRAVNASGCAGNNATLTDIETVEFDLPLSPHEHSLMATSVVLLWNDPTCGITPSSYQLQWRLSGGAWNSVLVTGSTNYSLGSLTASTAYDWRVRATYAGGTSAYTGIRTFTTPAMRLADAYDIQLSPDPVSDVFTIHWNGAEANYSMLHIYDIHGKLVKSIGLQQAVNNVEVNVSDLPQGIYMFTLSGSSTMCTGKFIRI